MFVSWKHVPACLSLILLVSLPAHSFAGGMEIPDNGTRSVGRAGAYSAAVAEPSALYYNPAGLSQVEGFGLTVNANLWLYDILFQREPYTAELLAGSETTYPFEVSENENSFFPAPMLFASHDFGLEDWDFGLGVYGPSSIGNLAFGTPDLEELGDLSTDDTTARDYGHGYMIEDTNMLLVYFSGGAAYNFGPVQIGLTLQLAWLKAEFTNGADGGGVSDALASSVEEPSVYTRNMIEASGVAPTGIIGVRYQPFDALTLALSYRPRFSFEATGDLTIIFPPALEDLVSLTESGLTLELTMPDVIRFGARWAFISGGKEVADIELDVVYETWSLTESIVATFDGSIDVSLFNEQRKLPQVVLPKYFNDTLSLRLGGDVHVTDALTVRAGTFYEGAANGEFFSQGSTSPGFTSLDFMPFQRFGVSLGASYVIGDWSLDAAWMHIFSPETVEDNGQVDILFPLWTCQDPQTPQIEEQCNDRDDSPFHAVNNGRYDVDYDLFSVGFTLNIK